jgi:hypothetical protein
MVYICDLGLFNAYIVSFKWMLQRSVSVHPVYLFYFALTRTSVEYIFMSLSYFWSMPTSRLPDTVNHYLHNCNDHTLCVTNARRTDVWQTTVTGHWPRIGRRQKGAEGE